MSIFFSLRQNDVLIKLISYGALLLYTALDYMSKKYGIWVFIRLSKLESADWKITRMVYIIIDKNK